MSRPRVRTKPAAATARKPFRVVLDITPARVAGALCSAWEGGLSVYWCESDDTPYLWRDENGNDLGNKGMRLILPFRLRITGWEHRSTIPRVDPKTGTVTVDEARIQAGLQLMARHSPRLFAAEFPADENDYRGDANSADVFLQYCAFGEVVFG